MPIVPGATVEDYLRDGCGRCRHYRTPACKVHRFPRELETLRALVLASGLDEDVKWGSPCYALGGKNVVMLAAFKDHVALSFFKGAALEGVALEGDHPLLESAGPNSRFVRLVRFRSMADVTARRAGVVRLVAQAIELERAGTKIEVAPASEPIPDELARRLASDAGLRRAFDALTPGRRRSHVLHVAGAKASATRERRVERCVPDILAGKGFHER